MSDPSLPVGSADDGSRAPNVERLVHQEVQYEEADVGVSGIVAVLVAIASVFVGVSLVSRWLLNLNKSDVDRAAQAPHYSVPAEQLPATPRLEPLDRSETTAVSEVFAKQLALEHLLHSYGDTAERGFVHVPIEQAMKLAIDAISVRPGAPQPPAKGFGLVGGGESNSGRLYSEAPSWLRPKK